MQIRILHKQLHDMAPALQMRYSRYEEFIPPNAARIMTDVYDFIPTGHVFGGFTDDGKMVATMRINEAPLPCEPYFHSVGALPGKVAEVSRLISAPEVSTGTRMKVLAQLVREAAVTAMALDVETIITTSKANTLGFYKKLFGFQQIEEGDKYPPFHDRIFLLRCDLDEALKSFRGHSVVTGITRVMVEQRRYELDAVSAAA
jgi:hypothetical protein